MYRSSRQIDRYGAYAGYHFMRELLVRRGARTLLTLGGDGQVAPLHLETVMSRQFQGVWIPAEIWLIEGIDATEKCLMIEIDSFCRSGVCYAGNDHFARLFGCSISTITRSISHLIKLGLIRANYERTKEGTIRTLVRQPLVKLTSAHWSIH